MYLLRSRRWVEPVLSDISLELPGYSCRIDEQCWRFALINSYCDSAVTVASCGFVGARAGPSTISSHVAPLRLLEVLRDLKSSDTINI